jgi:hypothetical protein
MAAASLKSSVKRYDLASTSPTTCLPRGTLLVMARSVFVLTSSVSHSTLTTTRPRSVARPSSCIWKYPRRSLIPDAWIRARPWYHSFCSNRHGKHDLQAVWRWG